MLVNLTMKNRKNKLYIISFQFGWAKDKNSELKAIMMPPCAKTAPEAVTKSLRCDCSKSECKSLACKCRKNLRPCSEYCSCVNSNCENPYNEVEDDCEVEDDDSESDSETESF